MKSCKPTHADVIIDGKPFRLEALGELDILEKLLGLRGVRFQTRDRTRKRLENEKPDPAETRRRREALKAQIRATEFPPELMEIPFSRRPHKYRLWRDTS